MSWVETVSNKIVNVSRKGLFLFILSESSINSNFVKKEIDLAKVNNARIITLILGEDNECGEVFRKQNDLNEVYMIPTNPDKEHIEYIVGLIDSSLQNKINDLNKKKKDDN